MNPIQSRLRASMAAICASNSSMAALIGTKFAKIRVATRSRITGANPSAMPLINASVRGSFRAGRSFALGRCDQTAS